MFRFFTIISCMLVVSCVSIAPIVNPNKLIGIYGVSSLPPQNGEWLIHTSSGYQTTLGKKGTNKNESLVANVSIHQLPEFKSDDEFLNHVIKSRNSAPNIGRFETQLNTTNLSLLKGATCVKHHSISKDKNAQIGGGKTAVMVLENIGYNCKHPKNNTVGVNIEYSLRHYAKTEYSAFENNGNAFFNNISFTDF